MCPVREPFCGMGPSIRFMRAPTCEMDPRICFMRGPICEMDARICFMRAPICEMDAPILFMRAPIREMDARVHFMRRPICAMDSPIRFMRAPICEMNARIHFMRGRICAMDGPIHFMGARFCEMDPPVHFMGDRLSRHRHIACFICGHDGYFAPVHRRILAGSRRHRCRVQRERCAVAEQDPRPMRASASLASTTSSPERRARAFQPMAAAKRGNASRPGRDVPRSDHEDVNRRLGHFARHADDGGIPYAHCH
jgi:hypothetical protein